MNDNHKISNKTITIILIVVSSLANLGAALISNWHNLFSDTGQQAITTEQQNKTIERLKETIEQQNKTIKQQKQAIEQQNPTKELQKATTKTQGVAIVFDPPSNVRNTPNGEMICSVRKVDNIDLYGTTEKGWYRSDVCGQMGYIHKSQIRFHE